MAINTAAANNQAARLSSCVSQLKRAREQLLNYKSSIAVCWQGKETAYLIRSVEQTITQIDEIIRELGSMGSSVKDTAMAIKREEEAAAAAAAAAAARNAELRRQRLQAAQTAYDQACAERDELLKARDSLRKKIGNNLLMMFSKADELEKLEKQIQEAEKKCSSCAAALKAAKG